MSDGKDYLTLTNQLQCTDYIGNHGGLRDLHLIGKLINDQKVIRIILKACRPVIVP